MGRLFQVSLAVFIVSIISLFKFVASEENEDENIQVLIYFIIYLF